MTLPLTLCLPLLFSACDAFPDLLQLQSDKQTADWVYRWNQIAVDSSGVDHASAAPQQFGPTRASRAMAIVHIAMFESVNAIAGGYQSYTGTAPAPRNTSMRAAIAQAAHDTLVKLFTAQIPVFDARLAEDLAAVTNAEALTNGIALGQQTAAAILAKRANDGSSATVNYTYGTLPGLWRVDPLNPTFPVIGAEWPGVTPFVMTRANQFRAPPPPPLSSAEYTAAYNLTKQLGGDGVTTPTTRTAEQTQIGIFWAYDGTPSLCAPPRLYNQVCVKLARDLHLSGPQVARMLAMVNTAMADNAIACWESKYFYNYWRPVTGIRESDAGTGPSGLGDGNPDTTGDPTFTPLGAPASNLIGPNFTPPFPSYPSGHGSFGGVVFQTLRRFFGTDRIRFTFVSDELNGVTLDNTGATRPRVPRTFRSLSQAEEENGQSRIYLGIHWIFDKTEGIALGRRVANYVADNAFQPLP